MASLEAINFSATEFLSSTKEQARILSIFENLRNSEDGWKTCITAINVETIDDQLKFFCLQAVENYIKTRYANATEDGVLLMKNFINEWLEQINRKAKVADSYFLKNKMAQLFSLVFISDFPHRWQQFLHDVFLNKFSHDNESLVEFYLLVLLQIDTEISDREIPKTKEIADRNTLVRDNMRIYCVVDMVESWYQILIKNMPSNARLTSLCLNCIGAFVAWIDINLIANDRFIPLIVECLNLNENIQEAASDCICSILNKGMDSGLKLQLVQAMDKILSERGVFDIAKAGNPVEENLLKVSEIVTCIGSVLIDCYNKVIKAPNLISLGQEILNAIDSKLNIVLTCLADEDITVATYAAEFCHDYVVLLKQRAPLDWKLQEFLKALLNVLIRRYRFPPDYNHEHEGENEAEFLNFRKELKTIFINVSLLDLPLVVNIVEKFVIESFEKWRELSYMDIELALTLLFIVGEVLQFSHSNTFVSPDETGLRLKRMVHLMITSGVSNQKHPAVCLQYFETVCRYDKLIAGESTLIPDIIASFLDQRGLHHSQPKVRSRATYLFSKFIRSQKSSVQNQVAQILFYLQDLLELSPKSNECLLTSEDQLFLFETIGILIVSGNHNAQDKRNYMHQLLGNLVSRYNEAMNLLTQVSDEEERRALIDFLNYIMAYASRISKAFSSQVTMKTCLCEDIFLQLMKVFLESLQPAHAALLNGLRQYLHRMIISLGVEILPDFPLIIQKFISIINESRLLQDFLTLLQQAILKYKKDFVNTCKNDMTIVYTTVWKALSITVDPNDEIATRDASYLKRAYYQLLCAIAKNNLLELWTCIGQDNFNVLLRSIVEGVLMIQEPMVQKLCFNTMQRCIDCHVTDATSVPWLFDFIYSQMLPTCFAVPLKVGFDYNDAQSIMVISEIGTFLKQCVDVKGEEILAYISQTLWIQARLPPEYANEFCFALKSMDPKAFQKYLKVFFENLTRIIKYT